MTHTHARWQHPRDEQAALEVLEGNWTGRYTTPATGLYPHQWSWDSAFIAIGLRHRWPDRARSELSTLFDAQWSDGRVPQIVYDADRDEDYQPNGAFWRTQELAGAPVPTAGLVQPPNHAWAAWLVHLADPAGSADVGFLERLYPRLVAWHEYLRTVRADAGSGLAAIVHPWESGTDNSPLWDETMAPLPKVHRAVPRPDLEHAGPGERPSAKEYGTYYWLAERYRDAGCDHRGEPWPFLVEDPTTNALWAHAELQLARIAAQVGADPAPHRRRAGELTDSLGGLFDDELGLFVARDISAIESCPGSAGRLVPRATVGGLLPLVLPGLPQAERLLETVHSPRFLGRGALLVPSYDATAPDHDPALYWRGPAWFNMTWLVIAGLRTHHHSATADRLAGALVELAARGSFSEYVHPWTGTPHGSRRFSWTAALALDVVAGGPEPTLCE